MLKGVSLIWNNSVACMLPISNELHMHRTNCISNLVCKGHVPTSRYIIQIYWIVACRMLLLLFQRNGLWINITLWEIHLTQTQRRCHCWVDVGPASQTMGQRYPSIGPTPHVSLSTYYYTSTVNNLAMPQLFQIKTIYLDTRHTALYDDQAWN